MAVVTVEGLVLYCNEVLGGDYKHVKVLEKLSEFDQSPQETNFQTAIVKESVSEPVVFEGHELDHTGLRLTSEGKTLDEDLAVYVLAGDINPEGDYKVESIKTFLQIRGTELTDVAIERLVELSVKA